MDGVGLALDCRLSVDRLVSASLQGEARGFEGFWAIHYHYYRDPFAVLAAVASRTSKVSLGTAITNVYERHPIAVAMSAATIQEMTNGRMVLGLGRGVREITESQMGIPYRDSFALTSEAVGVIRGFLSGESVKFKGNFYDIKNVSIGFKPSRTKLPIYLAAMGQKALRMAAQIADGVVLNYCTAPAYVAYALEEIKKHRSDLSDFGIASLIWAIPDETQEAIDRAKHTLADLLSFPGFGETLLPFVGGEKDTLELIRRYYFLPWGRRDLDSAANIVSDNLLRSVTILGEGRASSRLKEYVDAGVNQPIIVPLGGPNQLERAIELFSSL